jgi:hypothetical protein
MIEFEGRSVGLYIDAGEAVFVPLGRVVDLDGQMTEGAPLTLENIGCVAVKGHSDGVGGSLWIGHYGVTSARRNCDRSPIALFACIGKLNASFPKPLGDFGRAHRPKSMPIPREARHTQSTSTARAC